MPDTTARAARRRQTPPKSRRPVPASLPGRSRRRCGPDLRGERGARVLERPAHLRDLGDAGHEDQNCAGLPSARWLASVLRCLQMSDARASVGDSAQAPMWRAEVGRGEPSPGADVGGAHAVLCRHNRSNERLDQLVPVYMCVCVCVCVYACVWVCVYMCVCVCDIYVLARAQLSGLSREG